MDVVVLVPFRGDGAWRDRAFEATISHLEGLGWPIFVGDSGDDPFSFGRTFNLLADRPWDVAVLHDADAIVPLKKIRKAAALADEGIVYPWNRLVGLDRAGTEHFYRTGEPGTVRRKRPPGKLPKGGPRVVSRRLWDTVRGFDPRFKGWGREDNAFAYVAARLSGPPRRLDGTLVELWHPKPEDAPDDPYFLRTAENKRVYRDIKRNAHRLAEYVRDR